MDVMDVRAYKTIISYIALPLSENKSCISFQSIRIFFSLHEVKIRLHIIISRLCKLSSDCICYIEMQRLKNRILKNTG